MLEKKLQTGMAANWLPTNEATAGAGKELSVGAVNLSGAEGIYLPFAKNGINYVESQGKDVISYNFTGYIPNPPQNARFRTTGALQFKACQ